CYLRLTSVINLMPRLFYFNATATSESYTLSLHDALPIYEIRVFLSASETHNQKNVNRGVEASLEGFEEVMRIANDAGIPVEGARSEEHTSELQSRENLVCRLLLEKKK